jgi:excisionase family DNA binding protein
MLRMTFATHARVSYERETRVNGPMRPGAAFFGTASSGRQCSRRHPDQRERRESNWVSDLEACATLSVPEAAAVLGISRGTAYEGVRRGEIPALRLGRRLVVPARALLQLLGVRGGQTPQPAASNRIPRGSSNKSYPPRPAAAEDPVLRNVRVAVPAQPPTAVRRRQSGI